MHAAQANKLRDMIANAKDGESCERLERFKGFDFTGPLRPGEVSRSRAPELPDTIARPDYADDGQPTSEQEEKRSHNMTGTPTVLCSIRFCCCLSFSLFALN